MGVPAPYRPPLVIKWRARVAHAERLLGALPIAKQCPPQRRGALQERRVIVCAVRRNEPRRRIDDMQCVAVEVHQVAAEAVVDTLVEQQRVARLAADNVAGRQVSSLSNKAGREWQCGVVAAGEHNHVAHVLV
jgi:hypothetical protein